MSNNPPLFIVLAEDERQRTFVRRYLKRINNRYRIQFDSLPAGKLAGEQWVRLRYATNVEAYRTRATRAHTALVVVIDSDIYELAHRTAQLARVLSDRKLAPRTPKEQIAHVIPKRNIETWILCLNNKLFRGKSINEQENYKPYSESLKFDAQIKPAAEALYIWTRRNAKVPTRCIKSLHVAIAELHRLE